ncbi:Cof-type HAD-IIB family hydrolase [Oceanobacillus neutriphilus]|uniref:5-amino-6-(5-phospho-D-ribitylamino)uracil phosphatase YcsE n=1 Tax=Oceanobacillus neutriphilus TaxID=531815 RepID=A0ABQ2NQ75_9BACI|nr:Cof-type HAD-IIB family hydrolase [Oceanobacillus neutriphilus]GGP06990.1 5-amino-6-(5-phospho-D-ribitylamino)uracil phosphatase YcsE [Oceanobacillus neutriphilus]
MDDMTKPIKLIALDMDGTLLTPELEVSKRNKEAIQEALNQGIQVILSTGRGFHGCYPYAKELNLQTFLITANGGEVWTIEKELLRRKLLANNIVEKLYAVTEEIGIRKWMISTEKVFYDDEIVNIHDYQWLKFGCASEDQGKLNEVKRRLAGFSGLELTNSLPTNIEINPEGVSKANALDFLCERTGISMKEVMAVGDSLNDVKMIQEAAVGIAMGNAQEKIKEVADAITSSNTEDGVGKAIEKFALR